MQTLKDRVKTEFGEILSDSQIDDHLIPVITEWLQSYRIRKIDQDYGRRTSHDTAIDFLVEKAKL